MTSFDSDLASIRPCSKPPTKTERSYSVDTSLNHQPIISPSSQIKSSVESQQLVDQCTQDLSTILSDHPRIWYIIGVLDALGCPFKSENIQCQPCKESVLGGYSPNSGIIICAGAAKFRSHMEKALIHELIHALDDCRAHIDWDNLEQHACTEIRAATLSGDCSWSMEFLRGNIGFTVAAQFQQCVRRRAILSVKANPSCPNEEAAIAAVDKVFEPCFNDTAPFSSIPW